MAVALFAEMKQSLPCGTFPNGVKPQGNSMCNRWDLVYPVLLLWACMWKTSVYLKLDCFIWTWYLLLVTCFISDCWYMVLLFIIIFINYSLNKLWKNGDEKKRRLATLKKMLKNVSDFQLKNIFICYLHEKQPNVTCHQVSAKNWRL